MSQKQKRLLHHLLFEPLSGNVQWRELESLLIRLGGEVNKTHGARLRISLNGVEMTLHRPHNSNSCNKRDLHLLRDFLVAANIGGASLDHPASGLEEIT